MLYLSAWDSCYRTAYFAIILLILIVCSSICWFNGNLLYILENHVWTATMFILASITALVRPLLSMSADAGFSFGSYRSVALKYIAGFFVPNNHACSIR